MQIIDIILYSRSGEQRILSFDTGKVNIITGDSKTGKTAIIDIVDYCLGSSDFKVAEGVVREYVWWYAVRYQLKQGQILIARPNPIKYQNSASSVYFIQGDVVSIPIFEELKPNINTENLLQKLANIIGIDEYTHQAEMYTRPEMNVTFKHSRFYCFQPQTDIDQRDFLFYHQKKDIWTEQSIKDTLPYFLGAIDTESIKFVRQLAEKKRNFNRLERELKEAQSIVDKTIGQVFDLINEAKQVSLIQLNEFPKDREEGLKILQAVSTQDILQEKADAENEVLSSLQSQRFEKNKELDVIRQAIQSTEDYQRETQGYESEGTYQALRLESINIYPINTEVDNSVCPLCDSKLENTVPKIEQIKKSLIGLQANLQITKREKPKLKQYLDNLYKQQSELKNQNREIEKSINAIYKENEQAKRLKDLNIRKGRVLGRISLYLESKIEVADYSETRHKLTLLKNEIEALSNQLNSEDKEDKLASILDQLSLQMTTWAKELELEFKDRTIKFDIKKLTLYIISADKPRIRFDQTGSGENWVAYHLLIHFALHKYFVLNKRPTPNFLIIDQMSQAYFPPEKDINGTGEIEQSEDDKAINRLFDFIFKRTNELEGKLQTIIIDHAKLKDEKFEGAIKEEWRNGKKLVPVKWTEIHY
ncbi:uncharacterized protein DUF3732 [Arcicella aurantiaca]|uniref:Uncharacterized protein DUF3732 n=1 Tax=Arcicella aurantiaca TaxID=591202 RepID=A0A316EEA0_9BACT|nr:DUF3732 domain-containing protein [Arcicella aurantiaca]PWK26989.1 uncharacterized protein DUF3732 [Arcicella aurantiaca]